MTDSNSVSVRTEHDLLADAYAAVLEQRLRTEFDVMPYICAIELLESLPPIKIADDRIKLALETTRGLGGAERPELGIRALRAANPPGAEVSDPFLKRKWLSFVGTLEVDLGHPGSAIHHLSDALDLATQLKDAVGIFNVWNNMTRLASGAGQYEDAVRFATLAVAALESNEHAPSNISSKELFASGYINRANALHRLGRLDAAVSDAANAVANSFCSVGEAPRVINVVQQTRALCILAEIRVERGELVQAQALIESAEALHTGSELMKSARLHIGNARGSLLVARGHVSEGIELLERTLDLALQYLPRNVSDDPVTDILHGLQRGCRATGHKRKADKYLRKLSERLHVNAKQALLMLSAEPNVAPRDLGTARRDIDKYLRAVADTTEPSRAYAAASWQHLVSIAASACTAEESSGEHGLRVAFLCRHVALAMGLEKDAVDSVEHAALVHDVGKVGVPISLLLKREPLTDEEAILYDRHADDGAQLIERSSVPHRGRLAELVRLHHQSFDSTATAGGSIALIPLEARILAACDRFDALIAGRPRRPAVSVSEALRITLEMAGRELDSHVVEVLIESVRALQREHENLIRFLGSEADDYDYILARRRLRRTADEAVK